MTRCAWPSPVRTTTPTLEVTVREPSVARQSGALQDHDGPSYVQQFVPEVQRMHGRVPRSEEHSACGNWQYYEGENGCLGCMRALGLVLYNLTGVAGPICPGCGWRIAKSIHRNA